MSNFTFTGPECARYGFADAFWSARSEKSSRKRQIRLIIACLLVSIISSFSNHAFAITTTYYYPNSVTAGGGGTYCVGATATGLTGAVPTSGTTTGGSSVVSWGWYYNTTGATGTIAGATSVLTGSYTAAAAAGSIPLPSANISTATPGVYYYFIYITYAGGAGSGTLYSNLVTVTVNGTQPISGTNHVCVGSAITLSDATSGGVWSSSNTSVATVAGGVVAGLSNGTATIEYASGGCTGSTLVVSVVAAPSAIAGPGAVCTGSNVTLSDSPGGGAWSSSNTGVATIGPSSGVVSGIVNGTTTIQYSNGCGTPATATITVNPLPAGITGAGTLCPGGTSIVLSDITSGGTWSSSTTSVATASTSGPNDGIITSGVSGTTTITYTSPLNCITTTVETVNPAPAPISGVLFECQNASTTLTDAVPGGTWSSGIPPVALATGSTSGLVVGISAGTSVISYTTACGFVTAVDTVFAAPTIFATSGDSVCSGDTTSFAFLPTGGTWTSSTNSVATVFPGSGVITGISSGSSNITYTTPRGCFSYKTIYVNPTPKPILGILSTCPGAVVTLSDSTSGGTWTSLQSYVATTSGSTGKVTGVSAGTASIVYRDTSTCTVSVVVTVNPAPLPIVGGTVGCAGSVDTLYDATSDGVWSSATTSIAAVTAVLFDTSAVVTTLTGGTATISYTLPTGCAATKSFKVEPLPVPVVTYNWSTQTFYTGTFYTSYQWYDSLQGLIVGANAAQTAAVYSGYYWVVVIDTNGCKAASSHIEYNTAETGIATQTKTLIHIYPNPAREAVYVETSINVRAVISDLDGKTELEQSNAKEINISNLASGVYFISLFSDDGQRLMVQKLIKE